MDVSKDIMSCFAHRPYILVDYSWLLYDEEGSRLFEEITHQDCYYLTRIERDILESNIDDIIARVVTSNNYCLRIVELGAGTASKTRILLAALAKHQGAPVDYIPVDVSDTALDEAKSTLERLVPEVRVSPKVGNFLTESLELPRFDGCTLALLIGSTIGCFTPEQAADFLYHIRRQLQPGDAFLLGIDLKKDPSMITHAYKDTGEVGDRFMLNFLHRLNREFGYNFDVNQFRVSGQFNEQTSCLEGHLESLCSQQITCDFYKDKTIDFQSGDTIQITRSYKYSEKQFCDILSKAGFLIEYIWNDKEKWYMLILARNP